MLFDRLLAWLCIVVSLSLLGCGGRASRDGWDGSGDAGATSSGGASTAGGVVDAPGTITLNGETGAADGSAASGLGPCFRGFAGVVGDVRVAFVAFVQEPGEYAGDSVHILHMNATIADGRAYQASTTGPFFGDLQLHVTSTHPRFIGSLDAVLVDERTPQGPPLRLSVSFDVYAGEACNPK